MGLCDFVIFLSVFVNSRNNALVLFLKNPHLILVLPEDISIIVLRLYKNHLASTCPGFVFVLSSFCCHHTLSRTCRSPLFQPLGSFVQIEPHGTTYWASAIFDPRNWQVHLIQPRHRVWSGILQWPQQLCLENLCINWCCFVVWWFVTVISAARQRDV